MHDPLAELARLEGVPSAVAAARAAVDAVLRDRGRRAVPPEVRAASLLAGARANAQLTAEPERWLPGCVRVSTELTALAGLIRRAPGQALARTHALLSTGIVAHERVGQVAGDRAAGRRMAGLHDLLTRPTAAPALVVAAVAHAEIATMSAFGLADDLVARAVEHQVLIEAGVDPDAVIAVEAGHAHLAAEYRSGLAAYASGSIAGVRGWIMHCGRALGAAAEQAGS